MENIQLGEYVSVHEDRIEHLKKHGFNMNLDQIVELADKWTKGEEGVHVCDNNGKLITIVIRGKYEVGGRTYGKVRTMWDDGAGKKTERNGLPIIPHFEAVLTCEKHGAIPYAHG